MIPKFTKNLIRAILSIVFLSAPALVLSQEIETKITADTVTVSPDGLLTAEGNLLVQHGMIKVRAEALLFNRKNNTIKFDKISEFYNGQEIVFSALEADINGELSDGTIKAARLLLDETIKIRAEEVKLKNGEISDAMGISRVTSCEECEGEDPNWYLTASSAKRDFENLNIVYRDVTVRVRGLPIAYVPYLRMPDPSVDRAQGFLVPEAVLTSNLATGVKLPYFVPIGPSNDILVTPYFSSKTKTFEYRYRQKFRSGDLTVIGAFSNDDLKGNKLRYFSQLVGNFKLAYGVDLNFDMGKISDTSYLGDYVYAEESELDSEISIGKTIVETIQFFEGDLSYLRENNQGNSLNEYYSLFGSYVKDISSVNLPGKLRLSANLNSSVNVNDDNSFSRPPSSAQIGIDYNQGNFLGPIKLSSELYGKYNSFVNSADSGTTNEEFSFQYGFSTLISAPLFMSGKGKSNSIKPKLLISFNGQENDILGDYFIGAEELSWGNIFAGRKIKSLTESETGLSVSMGIERQVFWVNGRHLEISFAASKIDEVTYTQNSISGLENGELNYLGKFSYRTKQANTFFANALFSSKGQLLKGDINSNYRHKNFDFDTNYEIVDQSIDNRLSEDLRNLNFASAYNLFDNFHLSGGGQYDLNNDQMAKTSFGLNFDLGAWAYELNQDYLKQDPEKFSFSAVYDDECTRLTLSFENRYQDIGSSKPVKSIMFRVQLKPFANVVFSQGGDQITF